MNQILAYDPVMSRDDWNKAAEGYAEDREEYFEQQTQQANKQEELKLEQQKIQLQEQQLQLQQQKQSTNQQVVIGGLVLGGILVLSIALYLIMKTFRKDKKKQS